MKRRLDFRLGVVGELFTFLWHERLWWMVPCIVTLVIIGALLVFAQTSPIIPFLYTAF